MSSWSRLTMKTAAVLCAQSLVWGCISPLPEDPSASGGASELPPRAHERPGTPDVNGPGGFNDPAAPTPASPVADPDPSLSPGQAPEPQALPPGSAGVESSPGLPAGDSGLDDAPDTDGDAGMAETGIQADTDAGDAGTGVSGD